MRKLGQPPELEVLSLRSQLSRLKEKYAMCDDLRLEHKARRTALEAENAALRQKLEDLTRGACGAPQV